MLSMNTKTLNWLAVCYTLAAPCPSAADATNPRTGFYYGTATVEQPASLGTIDLAFYLDVTGSAIQAAGSYVDVAQTLLFPAIAPQIGGKDVGPRVSGTLGPAVFTLTSNAFQSTVGGKPVTRRVVLDNATVGNGGALLSGRYTETVDGLTAAGLVISGTFVLAKPLPVTASNAQDRNGDGCLSLDEVRAGGSDPSTIEFSDLSAALNLFRQPTATLHFGDPPGPNCANGEQRIQEALREYQAAHP